MPLARLDLGVGGVGRGRGAARGAAQGKRGWIPGLPLSRQTISPVLTEGVFL